MSKLPDSGSATEPNQPKEQSVSSVSGGPTSLTVQIPSELIRSGDLLTFTKLLGQASLVGGCAENCGCNEACGCKKSHCCENKCTCDGKVQEAIRGGLDLVNQPGFLDLVSRFSPEDLKTLQDFRTVVDRVSAPQTGPNEEQKDITS